MFAVGQEYRFRLSGAGVKMLNPVKFLFPAGQFVLFNGAAGIFIHGGAADDARLYAPPHDLSVDVERRPFIPEEVTFADKPFQVFPGLGVGFRGMDGGFARVDVGTADMEERGVISGGHFLGFPVVHDIIREGGDPRGQFPGRAQGGEGMESGHGRKRVRKVSNGKDDIAHECWKQARPKCMPQ